MVVYKEFSLFPFQHTPTQKSGLSCRTAIAGQHIFHKIRVILLHFHTQSAVSWDTVYQTQPSSDPWGAFLSTPSTAFPNPGPQSCRCVGIAVTQLIKSLGPIWKWLAFETHQQLQSPDWSSADAIDLADCLHKTSFGEKWKLLSDKPVNVIKHPEVVTFNTGGMFFCFFSFRYTNDRGVNLLLCASRK